ncbi:MAG: hypothetical protein J2P30_27695 [Actinobacteria bacterium]|nr:hypothetical protein [Actinomycetota bacterium]
MRPRPYQGTAAGGVTRFKGTVLAWGVNDFGQLGIGTIGGHRSLPARVTGIGAGPDTQGSAAIVH